jgi:hypothetical protein
MIENLPIVTDSYTMLPMSVDYAITSFQFHAQSWLMGLGKEDWMTIGAAYLFLGAAGGRRRSRRR